MGNLTLEQKKTRLDEAYKVFLTIFTLLLSTVIAFYGKVSPWDSVFIFILYGISVCAWTAAHLLGGEIEYFLKFLGWFELIGGIIQSLLMLHLGTATRLNGYYYALNWAAALCVYFLVFRYMRPLVPRDMHTPMFLLSVFFSVLGLVLIVLKFSGII